MITYGYIFNVPYYHIGLQDLEVSAQEVGGLQVGPILPQRLEPQPMPPHLNFHVILSFIEVQVVVDTPMVVVQMENIHRCLVCARLEAPERVHYEDP